MSHIPDQLQRVSVSSFGRCRCLAMADSNALGKKTEAAGLHDQTRTGLIIHGASAAVSRKDKAVSYASFQTFGNTSYRLKLHTRLPSEAAVRQECQLQAFVM